MIVEVLFFGRLRSSAADHWTAADVPEGYTVRDLFITSGRRFAGLPSEVDGIRAAVNEAYAGWDTTLSDGDCVAFLPPVAGGTDGGDIHARLSATDVDMAALESRVARPTAGAICTFAGRVRNHSGGRAVTELEYSAYKPMAERLLRVIAEEVCGSHSCTAVAVEHRLGTLAVGDVAVGIAVSAAHRAEAFSACRDVIERVKMEVPIFKREIGPDGASWVEEGCR